MSGFGSGSFGVPPAEAMGGGSVTTAMVVDGTLVAADLASDSVTTAKIADANVTTAKFAAGAVDAAALGTAAVTTAKIYAGAVTGPKLATSAVKLLVAAGRNGAGSMTLTGAVSTDVLCSVTNLTDGGDVTADFGATGTDALTQTAATDYTGKMLLVQLRPAS